MKLTLSERMAIQDGPPNAPCALLPTGGRADAIRSLRRLRDALAFSDQEIEALHIALDTVPGPNGQEFTIARWPKESNEVLAEIIFPPILQAEITKKLSDLESAGNLPDRWLSLWEKFVESVVSPPIK